MAEKQEGSGFTTKQKAMAGVLVVIVIFLIYEVVGMFGGGSSSEPTPVKTSSSKVAPPANKPGGGPMTASLSSPTGQNQPSMNPPGMAAPSTAGPTPPPTMAQGFPLPQPQQQANTAPTDADSQDRQKKQKQYLDSVNDLQYLKVQREIMETNQAIAAARLATQTAEKNIQELMEPKAPPVVPAGAYAGQLTSPTLQGVAVTPGTPPGVPGVVSVATPTAPYVVISVSMQMNKWTAVLGSQGKLYNVSVGDVLPQDGWTVIRINKAGVILKKDGNTRKISLVPVI